LREKGKVLWRDIGGGGCVGKGGAGHLGGGRYQKATKLRGHVKVLEVAGSATTVGWHECCNAKKPTSTHDLQHSSYGFVLRGKDPISGVAVLRTFLR